MTKEEAIALMNKCLENGDKELDHIEADRILVTVLREQGWGDLVDIWEIIPKWYA